MNNLARKEAIVQAPCRSRLDEAGSRFESVTEFLDQVETGVREFVRQMLQGFAEDEFRRFIGAKRYERTPLRKDRRNGSRSRKLETRFGVIEDLRLPRARKSGTEYSTIVGRYRRQDERIALGQRGESCRGEQDEQERQAGVGPVAESPYH